MVYVTKRYRRETCLLDLFVLTLYVKFLYILREEFTVLIENRFPYKVRATETDTDRVVGRIFHVSRQVFFLNENETPLYFSFNGYIREKSPC